MSFANTNPVFAPEPSIPLPSRIMCGSYYFVWYRFSPIEPGLHTDVVTVSSSVGSAAIQIIGNGIPIETLPFWIAEFPPGTSAERILYDASRHYLYVTDSNSNRLIVFDAESRSVLATIPLGYAPRGMALTPDARFLYVANSEEYSISEVDLDHRIESRRIILASLGPEPGFTPYAVAVIGDGLLLIGSNPPGFASGEYIYEVDLNSWTLTPRVDLGLHARLPDIATSRDFSATVILKEPYSSPTEYVRVHHSHGAVTRGEGGIDAGVSINHNGTAIVSNNAVCTEGFFPDLHMMDSQLNTLAGIGVLGCKALQTSFSASGEKFYTLSAPGTHRSIADSAIHEIDLTTLVQTRALQIVMTPNYFPMPHTKAMAVSDDGRWIYSIFGQTENAPPSKLLAMKVGSTTGISSLAVATTGTGIGTVVSSPAGIDCGGDCWQDFEPATTITLSAIPGSDTHFTGWSGDPDCLDGTVKLDKDKACLANFERAFTISVTKVGGGRGSVSSDPAGINCGSNCSAYFAPNSRAYVTAVPEPGSVFLGWSDARCSGYDLTCSIHTDQAITVTANFAPENFISLVAPVEGEMWRRRSAQTIRWNASDFTGKVRIELSRNGGISWKTIIKKAANNGSVRWKVGSEPTEQARLRICTIASLRSATAAPRIS